MGRWLQRYALVVVLIALMSFSLAPPKHIKIYLIGDSTMCLYKAPQFPITGWGMPFANYFDASVTIDNRAKGGRSTRTFLAEKRWQPVADSLQAGDYVLMQFGHNDEAKEPQFADRYTPVEDYKINLLKFITETRSKNAIPVLITPVSRRNFDSVGHIKETHLEYSNAVRSIGAEYRVPVIDLDEKSREVLEQLGPENSKLLFMQLEPGENPNYPDGKKDNTHFNEFGARRMAELVLSEIKRLNLELAERIVVSNNKPTVNPAAK
jgi:lysophospholipase L1-like esterase